MKYFLIPFWLFFNTMGLFAQITDCLCDDRLTDSNLPGENLVCVVVPTGEARIYENEIYGQWRYGKIILNSGEIIPVQLIRYDGLTDQLLLDSKNPVIRLEIEKYTNRGFDIEWIIPGRILHFRRVRIQDKPAVASRDAFLEVLVSGTYTLYAYRRMIKTLEVNKIVKNYAYYLKHMDGSLVSLPRFSQHAFLELFPGNEQEYRTLLKKNHIRVRNEEKAIRAIHLLNFP